MRGKKPTPSEASTRRTNEPAVRRWPAAAGVLLVSGLISGCGTTLEDLFAGRVVFSVDCDDDAQVAHDLVVLDWHGGVTPSNGDEGYEALDLEAFPLVEGGTLADYAATFEDRVREQIARIYCASAGPYVQVLHADETDRTGNTRVYFTQAVSPVADKQIGAAEYDACNRQHDNAAVIFGEEIRQLAGEATFDEWVLIFANVTAHEVGHTLGYGHIPRSAVITSATERPMFVELMLESHTMSELRREQRFVVEQTNCADAAAEPEATPLQSKGVLSADY